MSLRSIALGVACVLALGLTACSDEAATDQSSGALAGVVHASLSPLPEGSVAANVVSIKGRITNFTVHDAALKPVPVPTVDTEFELVPLTSTVRIGGGRIPAGRYTFASATVTLTTLTVTAAGGGTTTCDVVNQAGQEDVEQTGEQTIQGGELVVTSGGVADLLLVTNLNSGQCRTDGTGYVATNFNTARYAFSSVLAR